jgi:hypothetical protein
VDGLSGPGESDEEVVSESLLPHEGGKKETELVAGFGKVIARTNKSERDLKAANFPNRPSSKNVLIGCYGLLESPARSLSASGRNRTGHG